MQTPYRKPSKFSYIKPDPQITEAKFNELKKKLDKLQNHTRFKVMEEVRINAENGDFSENAAYQIAKGKLRGINQKILDLTNHLKIATIIKPNKNIDAVAIGHHVTISYEGKERSYEILGSSETDPVRGIISHNSPIGSALLGHKVGNTVKVKLANKIVEYRILKIE